jgi:hypothetical protein
MSDVLGSVLGGGDTGSLGGDISGGGSAGLFGSGVSGSTALGAGGLALGAGGLGYMLSKGPGQLPWQYGQLENQVPGELAQAQSLESSGADLTAQGKSALAMAQAGQLTVPQQAEVNKYGTSLTNQARQQYYSMGRNPDQDTSFIQTTANIDAEVNAMAQKEIQSTIALGLGEIQAGTGETGQGLQFQSAANQALIAAGEAQIKLDQQYSQSLTGAFAAIGTLFGTAAKAAVL